MTEDSAQFGRRIRRVRGGPHGWLLARLRIRKKLMVLHTAFSLALAAVLLLALRPAISRVVDEAEYFEAQRALDEAFRGGTPATEGDPVAAVRDGGIATVRAATGPAAGVDDETSAILRAVPGRGGARRIGQSDAFAAIGAFDAKTGEFVVVYCRLANARAAVVRLYLLLMLALLSVYALVAVALEMLVLPQHVYGPIQRMLEAERAVQEGRRDEELIHESSIPADELGDLMRWRNESILSIRRHERDLAAANRQFEQVATDLKRKNHLLETAQRNLADADRLASLGMMSAGIAHELNTPLSVLKGLVEKIAAQGGGVTPTEAELMLRVVGRLERLSESLLDFARAREARPAPADLRALVDEAWTLVRLDRDGRSVQMRNSVPGALTVMCDADRIIQVLVNLLRNAVDAFDGSELSARAANGDAAQVDVATRIVSRDGENDTGDNERREWVSLTITDNGPGIEPSVLSRLFEPFVSTRLDSKGTGLGLAVSEGIVREHGGLLLARNREDASGAVFEMLLPLGGGPQVRDAERHRIDGYTPPA